MIMNMNNGRMNPFGRLEYMGVIRIHIFSDSQAGLKALINPRMVSGQIFLKAYLELEGWCREAGFHVVFHWIPAHDGIDGNEKADELA
jgi:ribonuclease HI